PEVNGGALAGLVVDEDERVALGERARLEVRKAKDVVLTGEVGRDVGKAGDRVEAEVGQGIAVAVVVDTVVRVARAFEEAVADVANGLILVAGVVVVPGVDD